jgi:ligand-binding SRPBCC domain-containing protein
MAVIELETLINAPIERCFLLSLSVDVHTLSTAHTQERAVAGITSGLMKLGDTMTWRARHFYSWQHLTSKITAYNFPSYFCDEMLSGAFESIRHEHHFIQKPDGTLMKDVFILNRPWVCLEN